MQAFIKDGRLIVNSMIMEDDKEKLLELINEAETYVVSANTLYDIEGEKSGIAFNLGEKVVIEELTVNPSEETQENIGLYSKVTTTAIPTQEEVVNLDFTNVEFVEFDADENGYIKKITILKDENLVPENIRLGVTINGIEGNLEPDKPDQSKIIDPTIEEQVVRADTGYELASVTINAVTSNIDNNIQSNNIRSGVNILGVEGNIIESITTNLNINPLTESQSIQANQPYTGFNVVNISAVTSNIDNNILPENIKSGVTILNITGEYEGINTRDANATNYDIASGKIAYVNGQRIVGSVSVTGNGGTSSRGSDGMRLDKYYPYLYVRTKFASPQMFSFNSGLEIGTSFDNIATLINLQPNQIKSGENVLNIVGNYTGEANYTLTPGIKFKESECQYFPDWFINLDTSALASTYAMFENCREMRAAPNLNLTNIVNLSAMFKSCVSMTSIPNYDINHDVYNINGMFSGCYLLESVDCLSQLNLLKSSGFLPYVTRIFANCRSITHICDINMNTDVQSIEELFYDCHSLVNLPNLGCPKVKTGAGNMFYNCTNIISIPDNYFSMNINQYGGVMTNAFYNCVNLVNMPQLNICETSSLDRAWKFCNNLSDASLSNIMNMIVNCTKISYSKTLNNIGLSEDQANRCMNLPEYSNIVNAGWTTGF